MSNANDFIIENGILTKYVGHRLNVVIPEGVKKIGSYAFCGKLIRKVVIPEGVVELGSNAFAECILLYKVILPQSLESIMEEAFFLCWSLKSIVLPENVKYVDRSAFWGCHKDNIKVTADADLDFCDFLFDPPEESKPSVNDVVESITIPENISKLSKEIILELPNAKNAKEIVIPASVCYIEPLTFLYCQTLKRIVFLQGSTAIQPHSISQCNSLEEIEFSDAMETIPPSAFRRCRGIKTIRIPSSIIKIEALAFAECTELKDVYISKSVKSIAPNAFWWSRKVTIHAPAGSYAEKYAKKNKIPFVAEE